MPLGGSLGRERRYAAFRARFEEVFPRGLPAGALGTHFLYFDADWTPRRFGELGELPPLPRPDRGEQRAYVLRKLAPELRRMWAPRWVRVTVYVVLAVIGLNGLADPGYLVLAGSGALLVALLAAPGPLADHHRQHERPCNDDVRPQSVDRQSGTADRRTSAGLVVGRRSG
jgi:hypothetical protein